MDRVNSCAYRQGGNQKAITSESIEVIRMLVNTRMYTIATVFLSLSITGCAGLDPQIDNRYTVFTPIFADNRVYYLQPKNENNLQSLESIGSSVDSSEANQAIPSNSPISVILRSVEIPAKIETDAKGSLRKGVVGDSADYAVILDVGTNADGSSNSMVVWYQRGVQPDQSLNFSNLLVYYEPRWDERIAPFFRIRVMNVTKEKNAETRKSLERAHGIAGSLGALANNPAITPLIGISFAAADLVLANNSNSLLLDYSVQLYSTSSVSQAGNELGTLKRGSYLVVGRPVAESRSFWKEKFFYEPESRTLLSGSKSVNVPTASLTVGTFESVVPTLVMERSAALTTMLGSNGTNSTVEEIEDLNKRLSASVEAFAATEKIKRYKNHKDVESILKKIDMDKAFQSKLGSEDIFFVLRAASQCFGVDTVFASVKEAMEYRVSHRNEKCKG